MSKVLAPFMKMKDWMGKKAIMAAAALVIDMVRERFNLTWLPDREFLLEVLAMLLAGHTLTDVGHMLMLRKSTATVTGVMTTP